mmetsp:Transcript_36223/g.60278  ORF Transcript_36223/g.60278 Transcript_36223/m.60278 type:complete len:261 (+) Transcript_36223:164-946(+)|eukprot:CAMPEP_0184366192 /NCGR_PEP_ID=MMETSP1089-20130417/152544_1 /TAXON_ID=38269 ORGANISM="Gloeochaete wittrockiana, Strain SAG46.84" /NCGR_SAMPLE_ID=MMETSP1089 /ASSEMBLY_ACC=CAM_ASM_000445 /LENGTH=260 /DNA_ID=CAMNT_0026707687 /DNA_START=108 /DNA_END=890 /DNA_ORIENTATION=-
MPPITAWKSLAARINNQGVVYEVGQSRGRSDWPDPRTLTPLTADDPVSVFKDGSFSYIRASRSGGLEAEFGINLFSTNKRVRVMQEYNFFDFSLASCMALIEEPMEDPSESFDMSYMGPTPPRLNPQSDLAGLWEGESITLGKRDPATPKRSKFTMEITATASKLGATITLEDGVTVVESKGVFDGDRVIFPGRSPHLYMLLPSKVTCLCPIQMRKGTGFVIEVGVLAEPNLRYRMSRQYDGDGKWVASVLTTERRVKAG